LYCANQLPADRSAEMLSHASECAACGGLLADMTEDPGIELETPALKSSTPEWQRQMAARLEAETAKNVVRLQRPWYRTWYAAAGAVAAVLLVGVVTVTSSPFLLWGMGRFSERSFEYRLGSAPYQKLKEVRGAANSDSVAYSAMKLMIALRDRLGAGGVTSDRVHGRMGLLASSGAEGIENSVDFLSKAYLGNSDDVDTANDYAVALLVRSAYGEARRGREEDVIQAINVLKKAATSHNDPILFFNLALAQERARFYGEALESWNRFLKLDPQGEWAKEAADHIGQIQARKQVRERHDSDLRSESVIYALPRNGFASKLDLASIAGEMADAHGDRWLRDFLAESQKPLNQKAILILQQGAKELYRNHYNEAEPLLKQSLIAFGAAGNEPGVELNTYELAYAFQRQEKADECVSIAGKRMSGIARKAYHWLEVELGLTLAACKGMRGEFGPSYEGMIVARNAAVAGKYQGLEFRSLSFLSSYFRQVGSYREALPLDQYVLAHYWEGEGLQSHAYNAYYGIATALSKLDYVHASSSAMAEAVGLASGVVAASARAQYSELLDDASLQADAERELNASDAIFAKLNKAGSNANAVERAYAKLSRARFDGRHRAVEKGFEASQEMGALMSTLKNPAIETRYWSVQGELHARAGRLQESEDAFRHLLALGDTVAATLPDKVDRSSVPLEALHASAHLVDRYIEKSEDAQAWRIWTRSHRVFGGPAESGVARICYDVLPGGPTALIADASGVHAIRLNLPSEVLQSIGTLRGLVSDPNTSIDRIRVVASRLHDALIAPLRKYMHGVTVLHIAAFDTFAGVPFAALVNPKGEWLNEEFNISYAQSGARPNVAIEVKPTMPLLSVEYGESSKVLGTDFPPLSSGLVQEIRAARAVFTKNVPLSGSDATLIRVREELRRSEIFQFSGHAFVLADDAALILSPGEGLAQNRLLWASSLSADLLRNVKIAVLAACSTARPRTQGRYPGSDMARAFLLAGVPIVVASNWDVDSQSTGEFVKHFYEDLRHGKSPAAAVVVSAAAVRKLPGMTHPYYWAAFSLFRG
jgi:CHAT domain-containing protein/tetratricopeptide (TPR) repeat protein